MSLNLTPEQQARLDQMRRMTPTEWEALCKHCGVCCLIKMRFMPGGPIYLRRCCENLDVQTRTCKKYECRLKCGVDCGRVTPNTILRQGKLPASCGYMEYVFGPAEHPAKVDFARVRPIEYAKLLAATYNNLVPYAIWESVMWTRRR